MTVKSKAALKIVQPDLEQMEALVTEAAKQAAPMVQRLASHRDRFDVAIKELESERNDLVARRDLMRRQAEAVDSGLTMHIDDIDATMKLYQNGMSTVTAPAE